jgi:hypothetical protein
MHPVVPRWRGAAWTGELSRWLNCQERSMSDQTTDTTSLSGEKAREERAYVVGV